MRKVLKISRIMKANGLISKYTLKQYKHPKESGNESGVENILNREFNQTEAFKVIVSDLTYVRVANRWHYICILLDLYNREIIGHSAGPRKSAQLVKEAFAKVREPLNHIKFFHTDRGKEFANDEIDEILKGFAIKRSLSLKGTPHDNAVAEATFKSIKTEFVYGETFNTLNILKAQLNDYVHWYNYFRLHSKLDYMAPCEFKQNTL